VSQAATGKKTTCFSSLMGLEGYYFSICKSVCSKPGKTQHYFLRTMIVDHTQHVSHHHNHNFFKKILKFQVSKRKQYNNILENNFILKIYHY